LLRQFGAEPAPVGYRDSPTVRRSSEEPHLVAITRGTFTIDARVDPDPDDDDGWVLHLSIPYTEPLPPPAPPVVEPGFFGRIRRMLSSSPPPLRLGPTDDPRTFLVRGKLSHPPAPAQLEEWIAAFVQRNTAALRPTAQAQGRGAEKK
jgi:hypothetical protein